MQDNIIEQSGGERLSLPSGVRIRGVFAAPARSQTHGSQTLFFMRLAYIIVL